MNKEEETLRERLLFILSYHGKFMLKALVSICFMLLGFLLFQLLGFFEGLTVSQLLDLAIICGLVMTGLNYSRDYHELKREEEEDD